MTHPKPNPSELAIGLMSGTSTDGIDGVLLALKSPHDITIEATAQIDFTVEVRAHINAVIEQSEIDLDSIGQLDTHLAHLYARVANQLKQHAGDLAITVIGCHGQTVRHRPDGEFPFTLQLGNGAIVAQRTGIAVVNDFRSADIALGGQGAPLAPAFHHAVFASNEHNRALVNLGGIANITHLPADANAPVIGFDTGPANTLLDNWCQRHFNAPFDRDGAIAASGVVQPELLNKLLSDPYFAKAPPKSSGREYFNQNWLTNMLESNPQFATIAPPDIQATLSMLTATSIADQLNRLKPRVETIYVCGGGVHNQTLMHMLEQSCDRDLHTTTDLGIDPQWVEASAFAWMAHQTIHHHPSTLPSVTGAKKPTIAGAIYFPD